MAIGLLFSGQGAQSVGMGQSLYENSPAARSLIEQADQILGWSLGAVMFEGPAEKLTETKVCQPALFVHGLAVVECLREAGKLPEVGVSMGLSLGELTALTFAGAMDFETGLRTVAERGRLMQEACEATKGGMTSLIGGSLEDVKAICTEYDVDMANVNCPGQIVISGDALRVTAAGEAAKESGKFRMIVPLKVAGAYHSRLMENARRQFAQYLNGVSINEPKVTVMTNVTGKQVRTPDEIRAALAQQVVSSVLWEDCMQSAISLGITDYVECGPGGVLAGLARRINRNIKVSPVSEWKDVQSL